MIALAVMLMMGGLATGYDLAWSDTRVQAVDTLGAGASGRSRIEADYASVTAQSGIEPGDGGFDIQMQGNTDLKGGAITSTQAAIDQGLNRFETGGRLTASDLQNRAEAGAKSSGINLSSDMLSQGKYGAAKGVIGNALNDARESGSSSGQTRSAVSAATVTITDEAKQQQLTGKTAVGTVASLNRDTTAHSAAQKQDVQAMQRTVQAERAIEAETIKIVSTFTDEAYRSRFQVQPKLIKVECPRGADCNANPNLLTRSLATEDDIRNADPGSILAVNGILNDEQRAAELGYQNIVPDESGNKPTIFYLMYIAPADNTISELLGVAYEKIVASADYGLANFLGYTNGQELYADLLNSRNDQATVSLGHSRGTLVQEAAFTILANRPDENGTAYTNPNLTVRGVGGAANAGTYSRKAIQIVGEDNKKNVTYNYFSNDPISTSILSGRNPGVWTLKDLWQVFSTSNSMHSCYGTGVPGCTQVEIPLTRGPQGTPEGNAKLIEYVGGQRKERNPPSQGQEAQK